MSTHDPNTQYGNLLLPRSPLIGRAREIASIQQLLLQDEVALLILTGPGGIGKTRLALQVADSLLDHFVDGVYFVSLAPLTDPALVVTTIAQTLGLREAGALPLEQLQAYLQDRQVLLVLDNFEQILAAAPIVATLLTHCNRLKILVTSRAPLHLYGEHEFPIPPLALPDPARMTAPTTDFVADLAQIASVKLFIQRAKAVKPDFALTVSNAAAVAQLCTGLDGLPLAIELAASRIKLFSPSALLARLHQRLAILKDGPQNLPARQRTLRDEIAWSFDLLTPVEQTLFRRLAVFAGGFTLEAAHAVGNTLSDLGGDVLDGVASLVDKNLLLQGEGLEGESRFGMLETIREFGLEQLTFSGEGDTIRLRHLTFFLNLAEETDPKLRGPEQLVSLQQLEAEYANLQAALAWSLRTGRKEVDTTLELGLHLTGALLWFWSLRMFLHEGRRWCEQALALHGVEVYRIGMAKTLSSAGYLALAQSDLEDARVYLENALARWRELKDEHEIASTLDSLSRVMTLQGNPAAGDALAEESVAIFRRVGDRWKLATALTALGFPKRVLGETLAAQRVLEESLMLFRAVDDTWGIAEALCSIGSLALRQGAYGTARSAYEEALALRTPAEDKWLIMNASFCLGAIARLQNDDERATVLLRQSLLQAREMGARWFIALTNQQLGILSQTQGSDAQAAIYLQKSLELCHALGPVETIVSLVGSIAVAANQELWEAAALIGGAVDSLSANVTPYFAPLQKAEYGRVMAPMRARCNQPPLAEAWVRGQALSLDEAIQVALATLKTIEAATVVRPLAPLASTQLMPPAGLTTREVEVLQLLAQRLTYPQIAERLIISRRTVNAHVTSIYSKLGVTGREAARRFALDHHLV